MKSILKYLVFILIGFIVVAISWYSGTKYNFVQKKSSVNQEVILEQVRNVLRLGTVEGSFSEIYDFKEYYGFDISPFQKKALIRIKAKVLVGFDMDSLSVNINDLSKTVSVSGLAKPVLLSIDHDLDYYDITEGTFNSFTTEDYNKMNNQAKLFIKNTAINSDLFQKAQQQLDGHLELLRTLLKTYNWNILIANEEQVEKLDM